MEINAKKKSFGILGGSFDPPHKGHLKISNISLKKLKLNTSWQIVAVQIIGCCMN